MREDEKRYSGKRKLDVMYTGASRAPRQPVRRTSSARRAPEEEQPRYRSRAVEASYEEDAYGFEPETESGYTRKRVNRERQTALHDDAGSRRTGTSAKRTMQPSRASQYAGSSERRTAQHTGETDGRMTVQTGAQQRNAGHAHRTARRRKKQIRVILTMVFVLLFCFVGYSFVKPFVGSRYWTIAVFGVDSRDGNLEKGALSDVQMLASIDKRTGDIQLVSVYRDTYAKIDAEGNYHKMNEAYQRGGHKQAVEALEENLDIKIDDYVTFNWAAVAKAINALGGVDLEISDAEFSYINAFITETVNSTGIGSVQLEHAGQNHLDGVQAVAYGRLRLMDTDFNRTARQRKVIGLAMEKAKSAKVSSLVNVAKAIVPELSTSIDVTDVVSIARNIKKYNIVNSTGFPFSRQTMRIGKLDYVIPTTLASNVVTLHETLYGTENYKPSSKVEAISKHIGEVTGLTEAGENAPEAGTGGGVKHKEKSTGGSAKNTSAATEPARAETTESTTEAQTKAETKETESERTSEAETETKEKETKATKETKEKETEQKKQTTEASKKETTSAAPKETENEGDIPVVHETRPLGPGESISDGSDKGPGVS